MDASNQNPTSLNSKKFNVAKNRVQSRQLFKEVKRVQTGSKYYYTNFRAFTFNLKAGYTVLSDDQKTVMRYRRHPPKEIRQQVNHRASKQGRIVDCRKCYEAQRRSREDGKIVETPLKREPNDRRKRERASR